MSSISIAITVYAITGTLSSSFIAVMGSFLPYMLQFGSARSWFFTHLPYPFALAFALVYHNLWESPSYPNYLLVFILLGYLLHLTLDMLGEGLPVWKGITIRMHGGVCEKHANIFLFVMAFAVAFLRGFLGYEYLSRAYTQAASFLVG